MGHLAIYRKYRPTNFDEVSGQKVVVNILKNAVSNDNISHAYLFTGPRGTGKTSIAKILARTINCESLIDGNPCNKCDSCLNSSSKECVDIIEIDAASNNGVDEIRELKSKINIVPSFLKYKVYIIDEVHMLSIGAFNALLKTLEEPPSHAIFILATTEIQKVPITILSRCQVLEFKKISKYDMQKRIEHICNCENIEISSESIDEIINSTDGCMRDALSLLEKINSYCAEKIELQDVRTICGKPEKEKIDNLIENMFNFNVKDAVDIINSFYLQDYDLLYIVEDMISEVEKIIFSGQKVDSNYKNLLSELTNIYDQMKTSSVNKKIIFEIGVLNYVDSFNEKNISREIFLNNCSKKEEKSVNDFENSKTEVQKSNVENTVIFKKSDFPLNNFKMIRINNTFCNASKDNLTSIKEKWEELKSFAFDKESGSMVCNLLDGSPIAASDKYVIICYQYSSVADKINEGYIEFEKILTKFVKLNYKIVAISSSEWSEYKKEYILKLNKNEKYTLLDDTFTDKSIEKSSEIKEKSNDEEEINDKIFELFDSEVVEIK